MPVPILAYHQVTDTFDLGFARISLRQFRQQMAWLSENEYKTLTLSEYAQHARQNRQHRKLHKAIVLTFDDAYASLEKADEVMSDYGFVGTCFAISDYIGKENGWDYQFFSRKIKHADARFLAQLNKRGWEVGSHSCRHSVFTSLPAKKLLHELKNSKAKIADLVGANIRAISYPFGVADERICAIAGQSGYDCGVGLGLPLQKQLKLGQMCLPRLGIYLFDSLSIFAKKVHAFAHYRKRFFYLQQIISFGSKGTILLKK
jgi:peptidoglycan/xylan/chitin deacetylase (PgdA/CDA1 family)